MRIVASVQVRMGSERFPGKVMRPIAGIPTVGYLVHRLSQCRGLDEVCVATGIAPLNDVIHKFCEEEQICCFRGSDEDVLGRLLGSLQDLRADVGVVVYGDNPLIDPRIVNEIVSLFKESGNYDWIGNDLKTTFPPGMDVEVFTIEALTDAAARAESEAVREHGTLFIRKNPDRYKLLNVEASGIRRRPEICLGIDTPVDAEVIDSIVSFFGDEKTFSLEDILEFLDSNPEVAQKNKRIPRRWRAYRND